MMRDLPDANDDFAPTQLEERPAGSKAQPIGEILRGVKPLSDADVAHILDVQVRMGVRFGEAAQALSLVSKEDVMWALSQQFRFRYPRELGPLDNRQLIVLGDPYGLQAEAFRDLRSQIATYQQRQARRPIAVLSHDVGDGRSFVAVNLALSFCQAGERTVLVDANLRTPSLHRLLGVPERPSLSTLLAGDRIERPFDRSLQMPSLYVMQAGTPPPNPLDLLDQPQFRQLLDGLNREFDRVIVDTPAARGTADARVVAAACGHAVLVGRKHRTALDPLQSLHKRLKKLDVSVIGVVMNEV
jgi:chain length determinant protein tyrosine kinase EpsG